MLNVIEKLWVKNFEKYLFDLVVKMLLVILIRL